MARAASAVAGGLLELVLGWPAAEVGRLPVRADADSRRHGKALEAEAVGDLGGVEVAIAAVEHGGRGAVLELQVGDVAAVEGPLGVDGAGGAADAAHHAAAQHAEDVHLDGALTEGDAGPSCDIELVLTSGAVYPIHVGEGLEHDAAPKLAAVDYLGHLDYGSIQALSVANDHPDAGAVHGR